MIKNLLLLTVRLLNSLTEWTGKLVSWLTLLMVLAVVSVILLRNVFAISAIPLQESVTYMHAIIFMLGAAYALKHNEHVRVDVFYQNFSLRKKAIVNILGFLFLLLPVCIFIFIYCLNYVTNSWDIKETSSQSGGLEYLYMLKGLLIVMPTALILQGLSQFLTSLLFLIGWMNSPEDSESHPNSEHSHV